MGSRELGKSWKRGVLFAGLLPLLGGLGHFAGISNRFVAQGLYPGRHVAYLLYIGAIQLLAGVLILLARSAFPAAPYLAIRLVTLSVGLLGMFAAIQTPLLTESPVLFRVAPFAHLGAALAVWFKLRRHSSD